MTPTTIRFAIGDEDPSDLIDHLVATAQTTLDPDVPGFSDHFPDDAKIAELIRTCYLDTHGAYIDRRLAEANGRSKAQVCI